MFKYSLVTKFIACVDGEKQMGKMPTAAECLLTCLNMLVNIGVTGSLVNSAQTAIPVASG